LLLTLFFLLTNSVSASINQYVNFSGLLTDSNGDAVEDDSYIITFSLWDGENENSPNQKLWEDTKNIQVERGIYSTSLGAFPYTMTFAEPYFLAIQVNGGDYLKNDNKFIPLSSTWTAFRSSTSSGKLVTSVSQDYTITDNDDVVLVSGNSTITLPQASNEKGRIIIIKKIDSSNTVSIATIANETINAVDRSQGSPLTLTTQFEEVNVISDGQNWLRISKMELNYIAGNGLNLNGLTFSIPNNGIGSDEIASGSITDDKLNLSSIEADTIALTSSMTANTASLTMLTVWGIATVNTVNSDYASITSLSLNSATLAVASPGTARTITIPNSSGVFVVTSDGSFSVTSTDIQNSAVTTDKIADDAITSSKIVDRTITGDDLSATLNLSTVTANVLSLTTTLTANNASLAGLTVNGTATVYTVNSDYASITSLSLSNATLAVASPGTSRTITIPNSSGVFVVTSDGSFSVTSTDIQNSAVTTDKIADEAITSSKIVDRTITGDDLSTTLNLSTVTANVLSLTTTLTANNASLTGLTVNGIATVYTVNSDYASITSLSLSNATLAVASPGTKKFHKLS